MYKSHVVLNEIWVFFKRHIVICVLCLVCLLIILKSTNLPVPAWMPSALSKLFECPPTDTPAYEWLILLANLSLAFIASTIAYIVIQYVPERKKAYAAFSILKKELVSLYSYISNMIGMYLFEIGSTEDEKQQSVEKLGKIRTIVLSDQKRNCKIYYMRNGEKDNVINFGYNLYQDSKKYTDLIYSSINMIKGAMCSALLDNELLNSLSTIENNRFLYTISKIQRPFVKTPGYPDVEILKFDENFFELLQCHLSFDKYAFDKLTYDYQYISDEEMDAEREKTFFLSSRLIFQHFGPAKTVEIADEIEKLSPTAERRYNSEGVLLEMLTYYDLCQERPRIVLESALRIADYIRKIDAGEEGNLFALLNYLQVKKRMTDLSLDEMKALRNIAMDEKKTHQVRLGAAILCEEFDTALAVFERLSEHEKQFFTQCPIYHLWKCPPIEAVPKPMLFIG